MPYATVNGVRLYYERHGEVGDPLVLVHGYTGDVTDWRHQIAAFAPTHRVLVLDERGHGRSEAPAGRQSYTIPQMASDVEALIDQLDLTPCHLVGHSMGGGVVQELALRSPQKLLSLTLHDTSNRFSPPADARLAAWREQRYRLAEEQGMAAVANEPPLVPPPPHMPAERLEESKQRLAGMSVDAFVGAGDGLFSWEGTEQRAAQIRVPTLVIYGDLDGPALIAGSQQMATAIPGAVTEVIAEAGHSPQWERPEQFNAALRRFIEAHAASTRARPLASGRG